MSIGTNEVSGIHAKASPRHAPLQIHISLFSPSIRTRSFIPLPSHNVALPHASHPYSKSTLFSLYLHQHLAVLTLLI
jgi:hypothetical protein